MHDAPHSHEGFSDESRFNVGRYRSLALITVACDDVQTLRQDLSTIIQESNLREFKWHKLRQARDRFAAICMVDCALDYACSDRIRIDVLVWDTQDSRHTINNRDDIANLGRMHYHLWRNVMRLRWPNTSTWTLFPDEHSAIDWTSISDSLQNKSVRIEVRKKDLFEPSSNFSFRIIKDFGINDIIQVHSHDEPICQLADLFAGIGAFSYDSYERYSLWLQQEAPSLSLPFDREPPATFTNSEVERFRVITRLSQSCKSRKFGVGLETSKGFKTYQPKHPINFWLYVPQSDLDKAPTKRAAGA